MKTDKPIWEIGAFLAVFNAPLYPAAAESQGKVLPVPFVIYRGERLRVGEDGIIKAMAVDKPRFKIDLSLGAAFNANSDDAKVREGMPDLDFIFEVGPEVSIMLSNTDASETWLNLQFRKVFSSDFSRIDDRGYIFQPEISYQGKQLFSDNDSFKFTFAPLFATNKTHQYFYQVDEKYSTTERPAYDAKGGYLGSELVLVNRFKVRHDISIFVSSKLGFYKGASNVDSPLFKKDFNYALGVGFKWTLYQSN
ncbi:MipA/OmpV family protein [Colwellia sp. BRX10-3]|uniref:MipA/OmpV family protein n=1 Tax=Colwellia sp. BRX10-3 TaxID=2759844 RepID=UPI0015F403B8|nr:MipA/OmpV family protein [Colwellia sp. BRX10-3]MBA6391912.1 MipA/OmpV family protein [Colwellia sp. BRX10-3]